MRFRKLIIPLLIVLTLLAIWATLCSWKCIQLQKQAAEEFLEEGDAVDYSNIERQLQESHDVIWNLPWGKYRYKDLSKHAIRFGRDLRGGHTTSVTIDEKALVEKYGNGKKDFNTMVQEAEAIIAQGKETSFLDTFCTLAKKKQKRLAHYFGELGISREASDREVASALRKKREALLTESLAALRNRLNPQGVKDIDVRMNGDIIDVETGFSATDNEDLKQLIEKPGVLNFYAVVGEDVAAEARRSIERYVSSTHPADENIFFFHDAKTGALKVKPAHAQKVLNASKDVLSNEIRLLLSNDHAVTFAKYIPEFNKRGFQVKKASHQYEAAREKAGWYIHVTLDESSSKNFEKLTEYIVNPRNASQLLCAVLDDKVVMKAVVTHKLNQSFSIGAFQKQESQENLKCLVSGAMPAKLKTIGQESVSALLGKEAQKQGINSILIALLVVLLFMIFYYAMGGLLANVVLLFNILFILGALSQLSAQLTLPGIAGIVLTIGMAIDSNVIIFELIRMEIKKGRSIKEAIATGYKEAYRSIIDANITTLLTGLILYFGGSSSIKGFATTLVIGLFASFITSVILSQILLNALVNLVGTKHISFSFRFTQSLSKEFTFNFIKNRKWAYLVSMVFIGSGFGLGYYQGFDWGTDFKGGEEHMVKFGRPVDMEALQEAVTKRFGREVQAKRHLNLQLGSTQVRQLGRHYRFKIVTNFAAGVDEVETKNLIERGIEEALGRRNVASEESGEGLQDDAFTIESSTKISGLVAKSSKERALWSVLLALLVILLYIFLSFNNLGLALAALIALIHDTLALFACMSFAKLFGHVYEIDQLFLSTILTVIGYSINDTVVIFNGLRKKMQQKGTRDVNLIANEAINATLSRTLITSFTTFLPIFILFVWGGIGLQALSFSLLCGILWGTYSSVFIAMPLGKDLNRLGRFFRKAR